MDGKRFCNRVSFAPGSGPNSDIYGTNHDGGAVKKSKKNERDNGLGASVRVEENGSRSVTPKPKEEANIYYECTNCKKGRILGKRFAAHLEGCLGLSGRNARKPDGRP